MSHKIALFDAKPYDKTFFDQANAAYGFEIKYFPAHLNADTCSLATGYETVCVFVNDTLDSQVIAALHAQGVKLIALRCAGFNNVDMKSALDTLRVVRVPAYSPHAVAEHSVTLMLALNRKIHRAYNRVRDNNFSIGGLLGFDMVGKTLGVVGTGKIGKTTIEVLSGFGMKTLAYDPYHDDEHAAKHHYTYVDLPELYAQSDIITLHCPLTPQNAHMINSESIASMKDGVMIINTGRGKLIDTKALIGGLKSGKIGAAGLDVYEEESDYFFEDLSNSAIEDDTLARLMTFPNVLVTSHQAFFTREALTTIAETTLENVRLFFDKNTLPNEICFHCPH